MNRTGTFNARPSGPAPMSEKLRFILGWDGGGGFHLSASSAPAAESQVESCRSGTLSVDRKLHDFMSEELFTA